MREKRGQAAMEFLMTYGWAILAAVIVIGVLASFGVFNPGSSISERCLLNSPFSCVANQVASNGTQVQFVMQNGMGESVTVTNLSISGCGYEDTDTVVTNGQELLYNVTCTDSIGSSGDKFSGDISITYRTSGAILDSKSSGSIVVEID